MNDASSKVDQLLRQCAKLLPEDSSNSIHSDKTMSMEPSNDSTVSANQRFELREKIGQGGMGVVHKAYDKILSRIVAIKQIMLPSPVALQRFQKEAVNNASLHHPNIVAVHDFQTIANAPCIIMQYVEGISLADFLRKKKLDLGEVYHIFHQILDAVEYAHKERIVHRDLKPSNILLDKNNKVFITDFGIAKALNEGNSNVSTTGEIIGTPMYMSPEQAQGHKVDRRTDIYSLGAILYEMLSGQPVFTGNNPFTILHKVMNEKPLPIERLSPKWENYCLKALQKDKELRFSSVTEMKKNFTRLHHKKQSILQKSFIAAAAILFVFVIYNNQYLFPQSLITQKAQQPPKNKEEKTQPNNTEEISEKDSLRPQQVIAASFLEQYDENNDNKIDIKEWPFKKESFRAIDRNRDQSLTKRELNKKIKHLFNHMGKRREMHSWVQRTRKNKLQRRVPAFTHLDIDKNGKLSKKEFDKPLFWKIDENKDSFISKKEYRLFIRHKLAK
ncbi:protein kinase [Candidatus Uabimicrobium sp. HlEnr_7]|uniref:serine/threonine-protein kinase n=1 Tax=Candidatus Uabimicrobium helgolandensis TaxID=3095367 RepID=UPI0035579751